MINKWNFQTPSEKELRKRGQLVAELGFSPVICLLLVQRDITSIKEVKKFFKPSLNDPHNLFPMPDMDRAVRHLNKASGNKEKILICSDYDVDGMTAALLVFKYLRPYSFALDFCIPNRYDEGYGISYKGTDHAAENGVSLAISLDCGIKAIKKIEHAKEKGIDFVIYGHRMPGATLPDVVAVLDVERSSSIYPYEHLLGCGVGSKFMQASVGSNNFPFLDPEKLLELTAVSIASDIVPVTGESRIPIYYGLKQLNSNPSLELKGVIDICELTGKETTISNIVFKISPCINTFGRMMNGKEVVELLLSKDSANIREKSESIDQYNEEHRKSDKKITDETSAVIGEVGNMDDRRAIVVYSPGWHEGAIDIVASRLTEKYYCPMIVPTKSSELIAGPARSVTGFDIYKTIENCRDLLEDPGEHTYTTGLSFREENLEAFTEHPLKIASEETILEQMIPQTGIDAILDLKRINQKLVNGLKKVNSSGPGNQKPVFCPLGVEDYGTNKPVGKGLEHLKLELTDGSSSIPMYTIIFGMHRYNDHTKGMKPSNICYTVEENIYNGNTPIQLMIKDIKPNNI